MKKNIDEVIINRKTTPPITTPITTLRVAAEEFCMNAAVVLIVVKIVPLVVAVVALIVELIKVVGLDVSVLGGT